VRKKIYPQRTSYAAELREGEVYHLLFYLWLLILSTAIERSYVTASQESSEAASHDAATPTTGTGGSTATAIIDPPTSPLSDDDDEIIHPLNLLPVLAKVSKPGRGPKLATRSKGTQTPYIIGRSIPSPPPMTPKAEVDIPSLPLVLHMLTSRYGMHKKFLDLVFKHCTMCWSAFPRDYNSKHDACCPHRELPQPTNFPNLRTFLEGINRPQGVSSLSFRNNFTTCTGCSSLVANCLQKDHICDLTID
jgi:hypothetical protein